MSSKRDTWAATLQKMIEQAEQQEWWSIAAALYCAKNEVLKLTAINRIFGARRRRERSAKERRP